MNGPVPVDLVLAVDDYVDAELRDAEKFDNRAPLDESGVFALHRLVEQAYARGFDDGAHVADQRARRRRQREREVKR